MKSGKETFMIGVLLVLLVASGSSIASQTKGAKLDPAFNAFWIKFKAAVARNDKAAVADMTRLPFTIGENLDRAGFLKQYRTMFRPSVRRCFAREKPLKEQEYYEIFCGEEIFLFGKVDGVWKFVELGAND